MEISELGSFMAKHKKAAIIEIWAEKVRNRDISWMKVARECGLDYKWLLDFLNDGVIASQVLKVKKLDRYFSTEDFDLEKYSAEKLDPIDEVERLI